MGSFLEVLGGIFVGVFIGIFVVALLQASRKQNSSWRSGTKQKDEEAMDALDPFLSITG